MEESKKEKSEFEERIDNNLPTKKYEKKEDDGEIVRSKVSEELRELFDLLPDTKRYIFRVSQNRDNAELRTCRRPGTPKDRLRGEAIAFCGLGLTLNPPGLTR